MVTAMPSPGPKLAAPSPIRIGVLPTEDVLPLWAARDRGVFDKVGIVVYLVPFATEQQRDAAFRAGTIDAFVGDVLAVARLSAQGSGNRIVTLCLGATPAQGRYGIVASARSGLRFSWELANVPIATSFGTMDEYVVDRLLGSRMRTWAIKKVQVADPAQRLAMLTTGTLDAALLPEPFLSVAILRHGRLVMSDTRGANISQTVLSVSDAFLTTEGGVSAVDKLLGAWDAGASLANIQREQFRQLLVTQAGMPKSLSKHYRMNTYPHHDLPAEPDVTSVLTWMRKKGLLTAVPSYADITWTPGLGVLSSVAASPAVAASTAVAATSAP
jgi:NitT/TauT family transport system substrate-binding protein